MNKLSVKSWIASHNRYSTDIDGVAGLQCVDLFKQFLKDIGYPNPTRAIGGTGYADQIWYRRDALGYSSYFNYISNGKFTYGDVILWALNSASCPSSHVAFFIKDNGNGTIQAFGTNQGGDRTARTITVGKSGIVGGLRYKGNTDNSTSAATKTTTTSIPSGWTKENATFTITEKSGVNVRNKPSTKTGKVIEALAKGKSVKYDCCKRNEGYVWISFIAGNGERRYMAVRPLNSDGSLGQAYGTFK